MTKSRSNADFSMILASAVHDMKNSLGQLINAIYTLEQDQNIRENADSQQLSILRYESGRLNTSLVQLLGLYKLENQQLPLNLNHHYLEDFLSDQLIPFFTLAAAKNIKLEIQVEPDLEGYFDADLVACVINNVVGNAIRYSQSVVRLTAHFKNGLAIEIADDGQGYPDIMIQEQENFIKSIDNSTGSTGLGLYFAGKIAQMHKKDKTMGSINLSNGGDLGGGLFRLNLP